MKFTLVFLQFLSVFILAFEPVIPFPSVRENIYRPGDLIIGGLFPVHFTPSEEYHPGETLCNGTFYPRGYRGVQSLLFAVELVNNRTDLLPGIRLGVDVKDTCGSVDYAVMESLNFSFVRNVYKDLSRVECQSAVARSALGNESIDVPEGDLAMMAATNQTGEY